MDNGSSLSNLLAASSKILITSHISPDPDAVCSALLLGTTLKLNFPDKTISVVLEERPVKDLEFLSGYADIQFMPVLEAARAQSPELFVLLDGNNYGRCSRAEGQKIRELAQNETFKTVAIDHHEEGDKDHFDVFINNHSPATVQDVYSLCFEKLKLKKPDGYADTTMLGIITDSSRFKYANPLHRQTFSIVSDLIDAGANIESLENRLERYDLAQMHAIGILADNLAIDTEGYSFTYIQDLPESGGQTSAQNRQAIKKACDEFANQFLRNIGANSWGFIVYPEIESGPNIYSVSFRSLDGVKDVSMVARALGGGGHKSAAGAKFEADSVDDAIQKVKRQISGADDED